MATRSDVFRPRLPLDPFYDALPPWSVDPEIPPAEPHTILVLGPPTHADLAPLALSPHLASSLLVIATHTPPPVPDRPACAVVILRLPGPLDIHDAGAVRLVGVLDRAQRVAHAWHAAPNAQPRIQQLAELYPGGEFAIAEPPEFALPSSELLPPAPRLDSETSSLSSTSSSSSSYYKKQTPPPKTQGQYTFSALINFLPSTLPDKALLKHAILVTTLSAPFLAPQPPPIPFFKRQSIFSSLSLTPPPRRSRFVSLFSKQTPPSAYSNPPSLHTSSRAPSAESLVPTHPRPRHAHLIHVLPYSPPPHPHRSSTAPTPSSLTPTRRSVPGGPSSKSKLAQSIEQFLLSFAYPPSASSSAPSLASLSSLSPSPPPPLAPSPTTHAPARSSPLASPSPSIRTVHSNPIPIPKRQSTSTYLPNPLAPPSPSPTPSPTQPALPTPIPFLVPAGLLGAYPDTSARCIGEMVLCGVLDCVAAGAGEELGMGMGVGGAGWPRAWIGGRGEVVVRKGSLVSSLEGKGKAREGDLDLEQEEKKAKKRKSARARRNEAGLPTPPESSSSSESDSEVDVDVDAQTDAGTDAGTHTHTHTLSQTEDDDDDKEDTDTESFVTKMKTRSSEFLSGVLSRDRAEEGRKAQSEAHFVREPETRSRSVLGGARGVLGGKFGFGLGFGLGLGGSFGGGGGEKKKKKGGAGKGGRFWGKLGFVRDS